MKNLFLLTLILSLSFVACAGKRSSDSGRDGGGQSIKELRTVYFDYDAADIRSDQTDVLNGNARFLKNKGIKTTIEGHCDERGTNEYNLALGDRRAQTTKNYLINLGVDPSKMRTVSFGEEKPSCFDTSESCYSQNRRAEFKK